MGYTGDAGPAVTAQLNGPTAITLDASGNPVFADTGNHAVRRFTVGGMIQTIAGGNGVGYDGDGKPAIFALLNGPEGISYDKSGNLWISDTQNHQIRQVDFRGKTFERALETLSRAGALIERIEVPEFHDVGVMNAKGGFAAAESYAWHRFLLTSRGDVYDPRVSSRILRGEAISAADYIDLLNMRRSFIARIEARIASYDALVMPTTANAPPKIADLADDKAFARENVRALRNCSLINTLDGCAISLPAHRQGEVPVGLMLAAAGGSDRRILELAAAMENIIRV